MNIEKLMQSIAKIDDKYLQLIQAVINNFLQEIIDAESFYDNGPRDISTHQLLKDITDTIDEYFANMMMTCAVEFCITNYYPFENKDWNCINHLLKHHSNDFTVQERKYLKALNNSYMSIYKVVSVLPDKSVILQDKIEKNSPKITVVDKTLSNNIEKGQCIATRVVKLGASGTTQSTQYELSSSIIDMPNPVIKECVNIIRNITDAMYNPLALQLFANNYTIKDNAQNKLLTKKMWAKEIVESVYLYYANHEDYHDILDYDGNPWHPCKVEFDLIAPHSKIKNALSSMKELMLEQAEGNTNTWLWLDKHYDQLNANNVKQQLPANDNDNNFPVYQGGFVTNNHDRQGYHIFAEIKLSKDKLIVEVNSKQRANIAQDKILTKLKEIVSNPVIYSQS